MKKLMACDEDDFLQLSGLQHFIFCRRQWALIHIEKQWAENYRTTDGELFHQRVHQNEYSESRGDVLIRRGVYVHSYQLGVSGQCDVLEFHKDPNGITLQGKKDRWRPFPVEYKRGAPKENDADEVHLCAQAICLEEMLCCNIPEGAIFYGEPRRRVIVSFDAEKRQRVQDCLTEMRDYYRRGYTPKCKPKKGCSACSLKDLCMPELQRKKRVETYLQEQMENDSL